MGKQSNKKKTAKLLRNTDRERYPEDEAANPWLTPLLNAYHVQNTGIAIELEEEKKTKTEQAGLRPRLRYLLSETDYPGNRAGNKWNCLVRIRQNCRTSYGRR